MECPTFSKYSWLDFVFSVIGVCTFLFDWGSDVWVATEFYSRGDFFWFGVLVGLMVLSSAVVQMFSWFWFKYDRELQGFNAKTSSETILFGNRVKLSCLLHVFQLGFFCRYAGVMEVAVRRLFTKKRDLDDVAMFQKINLSLLRFIETFTESVPQLVLVLTVIIQRGEVEPFTLLKAAGSVLAIAGGVTTAYHQLSPTEEEKKKKKQAVCESLVYFLWNLLLLTPRIVALSLFASVLPRVIFAHFLCSWMILVFVAWQSQIEFIGGVCGDWFWRATRGLILYFRWYPAVQTRLWSRLYHAWMMLDLVLLCGLWCWQIYCELPQPHYTFIVSSVIIAVYGIGVACQEMYYRMMIKIQSVKRLRVWTTPNDHVRVY